MPSPHRVALLAGLLLGAAASGQTINLNFIGSPALTTLARGPAGCNDQVQVSWTTSGLSSGNACSSLEIWVTNSQTCGDHPSTAGSDAGTGTDFSIGTFSLATQHLRHREHLQGVGHPRGGGELRASSGTSRTPSAPRSTTATPSVETAANTQGVATSSSATTRSRPNPPTLDLLPQDSKIVVRLGNNGDTDVLNFLVQYAVQPSGGGSPSWVTLPEIPATVTSKAIDGLINGTTYVVQAFSLDEVDNVSPASDEQSATPQASNGFWGEYKAAGGADTGGCSATGAAVPSVLGALGVLVALLRRRR